MGKVDRDLLLRGLLDIQPEVHDGRRAPYQFLLLLHAIAAARDGHPRLCAYLEVKDTLSDLLNEFRLAGSKPNPANPWFALRTSPWWEMEAPVPATYKQVLPQNSVAGLSLRAFEEVTRDGFLAAEAVGVILNILGSESDVYDVVVSTGLSQVGGESPAAEESPKLVPPEAHLVENFWIERRASTTDLRQRREAKLQKDYLEHLKAEGHEVSRYRIPSDGGYLYTDLHDVTTGELIEVKASTDRETMRLALGQVLDYKRLLAPESCAVLVPERPVQGILDLYRGYSVRLIWPHPGGGFAASI